MNKGPANAVAADFDSVGDVDVVGRCSMVLESVDSTNRLSMELPEKDFSDGLVVAALDQTKGYGRALRTWHSPPGSLAFTVCLAPLEHNGQLYSIGAGLAAARTAESICAIEPGAHGAGIRWPNDLMLNGGKAGGILMQTAWNTSGPARVIVGIGLNVQVDVNLLGGVTDDRPESFSNIAAGPVSLREVYSIFCRQFDAIVADLRGQSQERVCGEWNRYDVLKGMDVVIDSGGRKIRGMGNGIDRHGRFIIDTGGALQAFDTGDVHKIRPRGTATE